MTSAFKALTLPVRLISPGCHRVSANLWPSTAFVSAHRSSQDGSWAGARGGSVSPDKSRRSMTRSNSQTVRSHISLAFHLPRHPCSSAHNDSSSINSSWHVLWKACTNTHLCWLALALRHTVEPQHCHMTSRRPSHHSSLCLEATAYGCCPLMQNLACKPGSTY